MTDALLVVCDLLLALGAALRLTRFIVADDVPGTWYLKDPLGRSAVLRASQPQREEYRNSGDPADLGGWRGKVLAGLGCPYCMSVWMSAAVTALLVIAGGPGDAADWWRVGAGFLTLAWITGHVAARAGDTEE